MKKMIVCGFAFAVLMTGCASHSVVKTSHDPATECDERFDETGNGSTRLEQHCRSKIIGGAQGGFDGGLGYSDYGSPLGGPIPYGGTGMVRFRQTTQAGRTLERYPGGSLELEPVDMSEFVTQDEFTPVLIMTGKNTKDIKKLKKGDDKDTKTSPPPEKNGMQGADGP